MIQDEFKEIFARFGLSVEQVQARLTEIGLEGYSKLLVHPEAKRWTHFFYFAMSSLVLKNAGYILEIGTGNGVSTSVLAMLFPNAAVYTIDVGSDDPQWEHTWKRAHSSKYNIYAKNLSHKNIKVLEINSFFLPTLDLPKHFDLIFVDGDHRYPAVASDISFAYSRLKGGGFLYMHDYDADRKSIDVYHAVNWLGERVKEEVMFFPQYMNEKIQRTQEIACLVKE